MTTAFSRKSQSAALIREREPAQAGFTLIEMLIAMVVASVLLAGVYAVYGSLSRSYTKQNVSAEVQQSIRATLDLMAEDIMMAGLDPKKSGNFGFEKSSGTAVTFALDQPEDDNTFSGEFESGRGELITYKYDSALGVICQCVDINDFDNCDCTVAANQFIDNVTDLVFTYLESDDENLLVKYGGPNLEGTELDDIRQVEITITVQEPAGAAGTVERTYSTRVRCRNFGS